jgi:hypothetical protein
LFLACEHLSSGRIFVSARIRADFMFQRGLCCVLFSPTPLDVFAYPRLKATGAARLRKQTASLQEKIPLPQLVACARIHSNIPTSATNEDGNT